MIGRCQVLASGAGPSIWNWILYPAAIIVGNYTNLIVYLKLIHDISVSNSAVYYANSEKSLYTLPKISERSELRRGANLWLSLCLDGDFFARIALPRNT